MSDEAELDRGDIKELEETCKSQAKEIEYLRIRHRRLESDMIFSATVLEMKKTQLRDIAAALQPIKQGMIDGQIPTVAFQEILKAYTLAIIV